MRVTLLDESAGTTIAADGTGTVYLGPKIYGHAWAVSLISIQCSSTTSSQFQLYRNSVLPQNMLAGSWSGNRDSDTSDSIPDLQYGERLVGVWTGADSGSTATMVINGQIKDVRS